MHKLRLLPFYPADSGVREWRSVSQFGELDSLHSQVRNVPSLPIRLA
jgi:hypothetical protein